MEYKRLTNKNLDEFNPEYDFCVGCEHFGEPNGCNRWNGTCGNYERFMEMYNRLAELEDKIEQGTLIELNDNLIGESVYGIQQDIQGKFYFDGDENTLIGFTTKGIVTWNDFHGYNDYFTNGFWFRTREEAEKRLLKLKGE